MSSPGFVQRNLSFQFVLGQGTFGESPGSNTLTIQGAANYPLRATALISVPGAGAKSTADIRIYGMTPSQMNQMSTLGSVITSQRFNSITVQAGNVGGTLTPVFTGTMWSAYGDYNQQPNVPFVVQATSAFVQAIKPAPVTSIVGTTDVATVLQGLATVMGFSFENSGVTAKLSNAYYYGSAWDQAKRIVKAAGIEWNSCDSGALAIWNPGQSRNTPTPPVISPETGMIGYPSFYALGIECKTLFNPLLQFGQQVIVKSSLFNSTGITGATGGAPTNNTWNINGLQHNLESGTAGGLWESVVQATPPAYGPVVPSVR